MGKEEFSDLSQFHMLCDEPGKKLKVHLEHLHHSGNSDDHAHKETVCGLIKSHCPPKQEFVVLVNGSQNSAAGQSTHITAQLMPVQVYLGNSLLLVSWEGSQGLHVVQAVCQLHQHRARV